MEKNFLIIADPPVSNLQFYHNLAKEITNRMGNRIYIVPSSMIDDFIENNYSFSSLNEGCITFITMNELKKKYNIRATKEDADRIIKKCDIGNIKSFYFTEYIYTLGMRQINNFYNASNNCEDEYLYKKTIEHFLIMEKFLEEYEISYIIQFIGAEIVRRVCYFIGRKLGISNLYLSFTPLRNHFIITTNEYSQWDEIELKSFDELSEIEIRKAEIFLEEFKKKKEMLLDHELTRPFFKEIKHRYPKNQNNNFFRSINFFAGSTKWVIADYFRLKKYSKFYESPNFNEKFVFFPLHYHCESRMTLRDPHFWRQEFLAEYIARSLPQGYKLYVKLHPRHHLSFPIEGLKTMSNISNIKLIFPSINSHDLIIHSKAVVTINSTTGFESILYGKPVVCFGKSFYHNLGLTFDVKDLREVPQLLYKAINSKIDRKDIIRYIVGVLNSSRLGVITDRKKGANEENIKKIADGILEFLEKKINTE